ILAGPEPESNIRLWNQSSVLDYVNFIVPCDNTWRL
ncbi:unnamed protein product, partial [Brassica oleracea]